jgi:hypothetical protein
MARDPVPESVKYYLRNADDPAASPESRRFSTKEAYNHVVNALRAEAQRADRLEEQVKRLRELVRHCWVHSGYENCGYKQMGSDERQLYDEVTSEELE